MEAPPRLIRQGCRAILYPSDHSQPFGAVAEVGADISATFPPRFIPSPPYRAASYGRMYCPGVPGAHSLEMPARSHMSLPVSPVTRRAGSTGGSNCPGVLSPGWHNPSLEPSAGRCFLHWTEKRNAPALLLFSEGFPRSDSSAFAEWGPGGHVFVLRLSFVSTTQRLFSRPSRAAVPDPPRGASHAPSIGTPR